MLLPRGDRRLADRRSPADTQPVCAGATRRRATATLAAVLVVGACSIGEDGATTGPTPERSAGVYGSSLRVLDDRIDEAGPGCSAAVGIQGEVAWTGNRGIANLASGTPIGPQTVFDIASVSKQFTATAILLLAQEGKLALENPLSDHVAGLPAWAGTVTVGQLMHHTSGIPDYGDLLSDAGHEESDRTTQGQAIGALAGVPTLEFQPGTRFEYSNSNYLLLAEVVRRVSGEPLPQFLREEIFRPLGLAMVVDPVGALPNKAVSYEKASQEKGRGGYEVADSGWEQVGDGAVQTTPSQLVRWAGFVATFRVSKDRRTSLAITCNTTGHDVDAMADALWQLWT